MYSDDGLATYGSSVVPGISANEAHLAEINSTHLLIAIRDSRMPDPDSERCGCKGCTCIWTAWSTDGGTSWSAAEPNPAMPSPGVASGLIVATDGCTYLSNSGTSRVHDPTTPVHGGWCSAPPPGQYASCGRFNGVVSRSTDGFTWPAAAKVNVTIGGQFGYSSITQINSTHLGLLWEGTTLDCINVGRPTGIGGQGSSACRTVFTVIPLHYFGAPCRLQT